MKLKQILKEILTNSFYIRDTLINKNVFNQLDDDTQNKILQLKKEFDNLGYIDARTQLSPNQVARQTDRQRKDFQNKTLQAFDIENKVKELLKTKEQKNKELDHELKQKLESRKSQLLRQIKDLETIFSNKLKSNRDNPHKKSYNLAKSELEDINKKLNAN